MNCILFHGARHMLALKASEAFIDDLKGGILSTENTDGVRAFVDLESYANLLLLHKFQEKGWLRAAGEHVNLDRMKNQWGITPDYERLLQAMLSRLEHAGFLSYNGLNYVSTRRVEERPIRHSLLTLETTILELERTYSQIRPHLRLLKVCMDNLDTVIQGHTLATEIIFPGSSMDLVEGIYKGSYYVDECNRLVANTVLDYLLNRSQKGFKDTVNILEIGAGTGGTSEIVLNAIKDYAPTFITSTQISQKASHNTVVVVLGHSTHL